ncbi:IS256 family transposase [Desulfoluna limicola]|uniref:Mutator family transposase n=1 Tax=Desulfoluna limicola TaxID=2810562 RepID=A0ABN6F3Y8_9BACT|nr:IS256 family transposase [Desulfoluna limicola]BCS96463.1 IS256 family transposase [Desulfoluna limicola]
MKKKNTPFDFESALEALKSGKPLTGKDGILTPLIKELTEAALDGEIEAHLAGNTKQNRRNGRSKKTIKSSAGTFELKTPRDRNGSFEPQVIQKHQTSIGDELQHKIIAMYAQGMGYSAISEHLADIYGVSVSNATISAVTDKVIGKAMEWQNRPLDPLYPIIWLDAIHYKIREQGHVVSKAVYTVLGVDLDGKKQILGLYISEAEGAKFWLQVLTDLQNPGTEDVLIACVDGLKGFPEAIETIFPKTQVQLCVVHQIRNSCKYIAWKDRKEFVQDLKPVYQASSKDIAEQKLDELEAKWSSKYAIVIKSWRNNWDNLSHYFQYPEHIRKLIYTTNAIEAVHRQFRKLTKTKGAFPNDKSLLKLLFLGIQNAQKKWTRILPNWQVTLAQLAIFFEGRLENHMDL